MVNIQSTKLPLRSLYSHWWEHRDVLWGSSTAFAVAIPPSTLDLRYLKSSSLSIWLLGYEFPETIMVFCEKQIHFLCSQKKASLLEVVKSPAKEAVGVDVVMHVKAQNDDGSTQMDAILRAIEAEEISNENYDAPILGYVAREDPEGKLTETWAQKIKSSRVQLSDITNGLTDLFAVKEACELANVTKAAYLTASVMKQFVVPMLENVINEEKKVTHYSLMEDAERVIFEPDRINVNLIADDIDICYPPILQSGGTFDIRRTASSIDDDCLYYESASVIICALGSRCNSYCTNVARSFLIDPDAMQIKAYRVLLEVHEAAVGALKPGNKANAVYKAAYAVVEKEAPEFIPNLTKSAGAGIGLEFLESGLTLYEKNESILKAGMVLNVSLGFHFQNMKTNSSESKRQNYALLLADTVIVTVDGCEVVTSLSGKALEDVSLHFRL